ncbi:energy-coupling factor ABC transporter ATP-binding protein [candidate division KSB1 bacterium]
MDKGIFVKKASVVLGEKTILSDINLKIKHGEKVAILGGNGVGKTTLLRALSGQIKLKSGLITINGIEVNPKNINRLSSVIGYIFQNIDYQLFAETVYDDVSFGLVNKGINENEIKNLVKESLIKVRLEGYEDRYIHTLSGGEKKRCAIAGILVMNPEYLLLDEPLEGLDPKGIEDFLTLLDDLQKKNGITILMATHTVDTICNFFPRILELWDGKLINDGNPEKIFENEETLKQHNLKLPIIAQAFKGFGNYAPLNVNDARKILSDIFRKSNLSQDK